MHKTTALHLLKTIKPGGGENVALNYAKVLNELNIQSIFVGKPASKSYRDVLLNTGQILPTVNKHVLKKAQYIFIHTNENLLTLFFFYFFMLKRQNIKLIYIQHLLFTENKFKFISVFINLLCTDFIQITPITDELVKKYIRVESHFIVNFFIPKYLPSNYPLLKNEVLQELHIAEGKIIVLFSGVLKPGKGISDFIKLAELFYNDNRYFFVIAGDGPEAYLVKNYTQKNLLWLGIVSDVERYLIASDIYFFPSVYKQEMLPMALVEAINTGKKIIAYNTKINNFLLNGMTFDGLNAGQQAIKNNTLPMPQQKFDLNYALPLLKKMLA